jgi:gamma-aminobutyric acid receptor subunit beta
MYLNQYWKDERLAFSTGDETLTLSGDFAEKIWVPDTFFANDKNRLSTAVCGCVACVGCFVVA